MEKAIAIILIFGAAFILFGFAFKKKEKGGHSCGCGSSQGSCCSSHSHDDNNGECCGAHDHDENDPNCCGVHKD